MRLVLCCLTAVGLVGCGPEESVVGTWLLESVTATAADGTIDSAPYGRSPLGYLTYSPDGYMQVIVTFAARPHLTGDWRAAPPEERAQAFATSLSYAGRYSLAANEVTHHIAVSSDPNRVGTSLVRTVSLAADQLTLTTPPTQVGGSARTFALTWRRAPDWVWVPAPG